MRVSDKDMEGYARDCVRLAQLTNDQEIRKQLLQMAREWMAEAMHESETPEPKLLLGRRASKQPRSSSALRG